MIITFQVANTAARSFLCIWALYELRHKQIRWMYSIIIIVYDLLQIINALTVAACINYKRVCFSSSSSSHESKNNFLNFIPNRDSESHENIDCVWSTSIRFTRFTILPRTYTALRLSVALGEAAFFTMNVSITLMWPFSLCSLSFRLLPMNDCQKYNIFHSRKPIDSQ